MSSHTHGIPAIPYRFQSPDLLAEALTHRSRGAHNYERLEFLGDAVLNLVVSTRLYRARPDDDEGALSRLRSRVVRGETLARV
ncbi:MAG: ribonuclease III domain-containing protein, partial [Xanthomonadales bacterium]